MMRSMMFALPVVLMLALSTVAVGAAEHDSVRPFDTSHTSWKLWHFTSATSQATYIGDPGRPHIGLRREVLSQRPVTLKVQSDAKAVVFSSGGVVVTLTLKAGEPNELTLCGKLDDVVLQVNQEQAVAQRGHWIRLFVQQDDPTVVMILDGATYATLTAAAPTAPSNAAPAPAAKNSGVRKTPPPRPAAPVPGMPVLADATEMLAQAKTAVFQIKLFNATGKEVGQGSCFVVAEDGLAITNYHVVAGAHSARVTEGGFFNVQLWTYDKTRDLALVRLTPVGAGAQKFTALRLATADPAEGADVWALGFPGGLGYSVTRGVVTGVRVFGQLPRDLRTLGFDKNSRWLQTDCTINPGNSGGPLINVRGEVVGVNTFTIRSSANTFFALSAAHVQSLLAGKPSVAVGFTAVADDKTTQWQTRPVPAIEIERTGPAIHLQRVANVAAQFIPCPTCKGDGVITVTKTERIPTGSNLIQKRAFTEQRGCMTCQGRRLAESRKVDGLLANLTEALAKVNPQDRDADRMIDHARDKLQDMIRRGLVPRTSDIDWLFDTHREQRVGQPVAVAGTVQEIEGFTGPARRVVVVGDHKAVLITDPLIGGGLIGGVVIAGGIYAGHFSDIDENTYPVLQGGYVISLPE